MAPHIWLLAVALVLLQGEPCASAEPEEPEETEAAQSAQPAQAQPTEEAGGSQAEQPPRYHEEIVVTATRYEQDSFDTPAPISVISREELERRQPEKLVDLLKQLPGIEVSGEGPFRGLPVIRGLTSNRVLILVDGERLNNARESTDFAGIQPGLVDLSQVDRIEVLRGPASVLYGSDAVGGVINIITRQSPFRANGFRLGGRASYEYGSSADSQRGRVQLSGEAPRVSFLIGATYFDADNYDSPEGEVPNSGATQHSFDATARIMLSDNRFVRADAQVFRATDIGFPGFDPATSGIDIAFPKFNRDKLSVSYQVTEWRAFKDMSASVYYQSVFKDSKRNFSFGPTFFSNNRTMSDIDSVGFNGQSSAELGLHRLTFGLDFYQDSLHDQTVADSIFGHSTEVAVPDSDQRGLGVYLQDEFPVGDRLHLLAGARADRYTFVSQDDPNYTGEPFDEAQSDISGNVGARFQVTDHVELTALLGRGFRAPNLQERSFFGIATTGDTFIEQNPNLDSERSLNVDAGFKVRYEKYFGGFTYFHNSVRDLIGIVFHGVDPVTGLQLARFENIDRATIQGTELELQRFMSPTWTVYTNFSYTRGTDDTTGQPLPLIPPVKFVVGSRYQAARWWAELSGRFVTGQDRVPEGLEPTEGFAAFEALGGYDLADQIQLQIAILNLGNEAYAEPFNEHLEPGRSLRLSVSYNF